MKNTVNTEMLQQVPDEIGISNISFYKGVVSVFFSGCNIRFVSSIGEAIEVNNGMCWVLLQIMQHKVRADEPSAPGY